MIYGVRLSRTDEKAVGNRQSKSLTRKTGTVPELLAHPVLSATATDSNGDPPGSTLVNSRN
jgi:hypothetical protein